MFLKWIKMCLHLFWQRKRPHMHKKLNNFRMTIDNTSPAEIQKMWKSLQHWVKKKSLVVYLQRKYAYVPWNIWNTPQKIKLKYFVQVVLFGESLTQWLSTVLYKNCGINLKKSQLFVTSNPEMAPPAILKKIWKG